MNSNDPFHLFSHHILYIPNRHYDRIELSCEPPLERKYKMSVLLLSAVSNEWTGDLSLVPFMIACIGIPAALAGSAALTLVTTKLIITQQRITLCATPCTRLTSKSGKHHPVCKAGLPSSERLCSLCYTSLCATPCKVCNDPFKGLGKPSSAKLDVCVHIV